MNIPQTGETPAVLPANPDRYDRVRDAAPRLLAALTQVWEERLAPDSCMHDDEDGVGDPSCCVCVARAVLAEVRGKGN